MGFLGCRRRRDFRTGLGVVVVDVGVLDDVVGAEPGVIIFLVCACVCVVCVCVCVCVRVRVCVCVQVLWLLHLQFSFEWRSPLLRHVR